MNSENPTIPDNPTIDDSLEDNNNMCPTDNHNNLGTRRSRSDYARIPENSNDLENSNPYSSNYETLELQTRYLKYLLFFLLLLGGGAAVYSRKATLLRNNGYYTRHFNENTNNELTIHYSVNLDPFDQHGATTHFAPKNIQNTHYHKGYYSMPTIHNNTLIFKAEGDLYLTILDTNFGSNDNLNLLSASKITTTSGNTLDPVLSPDGKLVAYTATYHGRRDVYVYNLYGGGVSQRVTYLDTKYGVNSILQWMPDSSALLITAENLTDNLPSTMMYWVYLRDAVSSDGTVEHAMGHVEPVPLSEAKSGVYDFRSTSKKLEDSCLYFVRGGQSSNTMRYVGGTAEKIWYHCNNTLNSTPITKYYNGTVKYPRVHLDRLMFLSDMESEDGQEATVMNLWVKDIVDFQNHPDHAKIPKVQLTSICSDLPIIEYDEDPVTGNVILRAGADLYMLPYDKLMSIVNGQEPPITDLSPFILPINLLSDLNNLQERRIEVKNSEHLKSMDLIETSYSKLLLLTLRGQVFVVPVTSKGELYLKRKFRVFPLSNDAGGSSRVINAKFLEIDSKVYALVLATDPSSLTAEHAFYMIPIDANYNLLDDELLLQIYKLPFTQGSAADGGLGSVVGSSLVISPTKDSFAWLDTDERLFVTYVEETSETSTNSTRFQVTPRIYDNFIPKSVVFSSTGQYMAVVHTSSNQMSIISVIDQLNNDIIQVTSDRFNSKSPTWVDIFDADTNTTTSSLVFLSDKEVLTFEGDPFESRSSGPQFKTYWVPYVLPFGGDVINRGVPELYTSEWGKQETENQSSISKAMEFRLPQGKDSILKFQRSAKRMPGVAPGSYFTMLTLSDFNTVVMITDDTFQIQICSGGEVLSSIDLDNLIYFATDATQSLISFALGDSAILVFENTVSNFNDIAKGSATVESLDSGDTSGLVLSIYPQLEYRQMFADAWRMFRDYFYDVNMHGLDWNSIFYKYSSVVERITKREELDDLLGQMSSELSALHVFVYGGEYTSPPHVDGPSSLGATFKKTPIGFELTNIFQPDLDFEYVEGKTHHSPLGWSLLQTGQKPLNPGDVIIAINGESVVKYPSINSLIRGRSEDPILLHVMRNYKEVNGTNLTAVSSSPESLMVTPISVDDAAELRYFNFESKTRDKAKSLGEDKGFSIGYIHIRDMESTGEDAFLRGFFPDFNKEGLIIDVRSNEGGNIATWIVNLLQRQAWGYFQPRAQNDNIKNGSGWTQQYAFRGHIVVLIDANTSSNGEGFSRAMKTLGLAKLVGTRTWGGGIWLSSDNLLVDGGIASAPEIAVYNDEWGLGAGVENVGVEPDIYVDNDPFVYYNGRDQQLEKAIDVLAQWLKEEPYVYPKGPGPYPDYSNASEGGSSCLSTKGRRWI